MKLKQSRIMSFLLVAIVYALAIVVGIVIYKALNYSIWFNLLIADVCATVLVFLFSLLFNNSSVYDPYWSVQPIVIAFAFVWGKELTFVRLLPLIAVCIWGIRLTVNWAYTFKNLYHQDWRYTMLKEKTGKIYPFVNLMGIHMFPTLVVYACILPVCYTMILELTLNVFSIIFFALSILAIVLQGVSDVQMHAYRKNRTTPFINAGLWKYSRHPNYLGEILMWWGIALAFVSVKPEMWAICLGALVNNLMFIFISIPMADKRQSSKDGYEEYKNRTRILLPIKKGA